MIISDHAIASSMGIVVKRTNLKRIDTERKVVEFDPQKHGKITGSRFLAVLGKDRYTSEFKAACLIGRVFYDDTKTKYTEAGEVIEPVIRSYVRDNCDTLRDILKIEDGANITVEEPIAAKDCYYDHFRFDKVFGGMVDGFVNTRGRRNAILEIKTSSDRSGWYDEDGNVRIPEGYYLQASLYAQLAKLDRIVFAAAFLEEPDYENPENFVPTKENTLIVAVDKKDISAEMAAAKEWFNEYIINGRTPEWTESDADIIDVLTSERIEEMPGNAPMMFKKYIRFMDSDEDLTDLEYSIIDLMSSAAVDGVSKVIYEQSGVSFVLSLEGVPRLTVTRI